MGLGLRLKTLVVQREGNSYGWYGFKNIMNKKWVSPRRNFFLGHGKSHSNIYFANQCNLPGSSNDQDVPYEHTRRKEIQKYLREICYHRIKCIIATFLAAFICRRPLNSATLATTTHRRSERVFDGMDTQVGAQMINKCKSKITQREL